MENHNSKIRIFLADDHTLFRQALRQMLERETDFEVVGEAQDGAETTEKVLTLKPDVVLMDVNMPLVDGVRAAETICQQDPAVRVVILTMYRQDRYAFQAIKAGAWGYLLKTVDAHELVRSIRAVHRGEALVNPATALKVLEEFRRPLPPAAGEDAVQLTEREKDILRLVSTGASNQEIAQALFLSEKTVENRLSLIFQKLHLNNRVQAALYALRKGLLSLDQAEVQED